MPKNLEEKILSLPPELRQNVNNFVDFLFEKVKRKRGVKKKLSLKWAGALRDYKKRFTSIELQKKALEWRD